MPNKFIATQPHLPLAHLDPINSSPLANAKDFDSTSECGENVNAAGEASKDVPFPLGAEIKLIHDAFATCQEESDLFLHPRPEANFEYWAKVPVWTLDEAIALSFGKNPDLVDWDLIEIYRNDSLLAKDFWDRRRLALRYKAIGQLSDTVYPNVFIEWARQTETDIPTVLVEAVSARWQQTVDWRQLCCDQKAYYDDQIGKWKSLCEEIHAERLELAATVSSLTMAIDERDHSITQLRECQRILEVACGEAESNGDVHPDKLLHTKERESLLKSAIGLAVSGHGYDPAEKRSPVMTEMIDDMAEVGISLSVDTLRKFLRAGAEFLALERGEECPRKKVKRRKASSR